MLEFPTLIVRKSEHRSLPLKPGLARRTSQEVVDSARSSRLTGFWSWIGAPPLHRSGNTRNRWSQRRRPSNSLVKRFLCIPPTSRCFPLPPYVPFYLLFPYRGIIEKRSILWLKHQDRFNICQQSLSRFNFLFQLSFAIRIPSPFVVSSIPFVPSRFLATGRRVDAWTTKGRRKGLEEKENRISRER